MLANDWATDMARARDPGADEATLAAAAAEIRRVRDRAIARGTSDAARNEQSRWGEQLRLDGQREALLATEANKLHRRAGESTPDLVARYTARALDAIGDADLLPVAEAKATAAKAEKVAKALEAQIATATAEAENASAAHAAAEARAAEMQRQAAEAGAAVDAARTAVNTAAGTGDLEAVKQAQAKVDAAEATLRAAAEVARVLGQAPDRRPVQAAETKIGDLRHQLRAVRLEAATARLHAGAHEAAAQVRKALGAAVADYLAIASEVVTAGGALGENALDLERVAILIRRAIYAGGTP